MNIEIKKIALIIAVGILGFSGAFGVIGEEEAILKTIDVKNNTGKGIEITLNEDEGQRYMVEPGGNITEAIPDGRIHRFKLTSTPNKEIKLGNPEYKIVDLQLNNAAFNIQATLENIRQAVKDFGDEFQSSPGNEFNLSTVKLEGKDKLVITFGHP